MEFCQATKPKSPNQLDPLIPLEAKSSSGIHLYHQMNLTFICTSSAEDFNECSEITGGKAYSWDFHLAPTAEVSSPSCPFT